MTDSVYDITPADDPVHGWHPGAPGNEVGGGRRAARLAAAAAAAASHPTSPDVTGAVVQPPAASPVYDLSDEAAWAAPRTLRSVADPCVGRALRCRWYRRRSVAARTRPPALHRRPPGPPRPVTRRRAGRAAAGRARDTARSRAAVDRVLRVRRRGDPTAAGGARRVPTGLPAGAASDGREEINFTRHAREIADPDLITALAQVVYQGASDLHVTADAPPTVRVDGSLRPAVPGGPWSRAKVIAALKTMLSVEQAGQFDHEQELDFAYSLSRPTSGSA